MECVIFSNVTQEDFDDCRAVGHIQPEILVKLRPYFKKSSFDSVWIYEDCNLNGDVFPGDRMAITFGEQIYFGHGQYHPFDPDGFAVLAHELVHVLQYRQKGLADFTCEYGLKCWFGYNDACAIEQAAYKFETEVARDQRYDGDGNFSNNPAGGLPCPSYKAPCMDE
jgi:hypothetical protein